MAGTSPETSGHEHFQHAPDQSVLERGLNRGFSKIEPYSNQILIGCLVIAVALVGTIVWFRSSSTRQAAAWEEFAANRAPEDFIQLADKYPNDPVGDWSRLEAGRLFVSEGLFQSLTNREASDASLNKAKDAYGAILKKNVSPELRQEALYGMATVLEALSDGDTKPAVDAYEELLKEFPNSPHRLWAESRIHELKTKPAENFYAWFRKQNPKPADRPGPKDIPDLKSMLPDLDLPAAPEDDQAKESATPKGSTAPDVPAGAVMPEKNDQPAPELPADAQNKTPAPDSAKSPAKMPVPEGDAPKTPAAEKSDAKPSTDASPVKSEKPTERPEETPADKASEKPAADPEPAKEENKEAPTAKAPQP